MKRRTVQPETRSFFSCCFDPLSRHLTVQILRRMRTVRRVQCFWQRTVWTQRRSRGEKLRCKVLARISAKLFANTKGAIFWQGKMQTSSPILARQWWHQFRLSLYYRKRGSASYIVREVHSVRERERERYRERERERERKTEVTSPLSR